MIRYHNFDCTLNNLKCWHNICKKMYSKMWCIFCLNKKNRWYHHNKGKWCTTRRWSPAARLAPWEKIKSTSMRQSFSQSEDELWLLIDDYSIRSNFREGLNFEQGRFKIHVLYSGMSSRQFWRFGLLALILGASLWHHTRERDGVCFALAIAYDYSTSIMKK